MVKKKNNFIPGMENSRWSLENNKDDGDDDGDEDSVDESIGDSNGRS